MKYSLFQLEKIFGGHVWNLGRDDEEVSEYISEKCFIYLATYDTLTEAKLKQRDYNMKTIILASYE